MSNIEYRTAEVEEKSECRISNVEYRTAEGKRKRNNKFLNSTLTCYICKPDILRFVFPFSFFVFRFSFLPFEIRYSIFDIRYSAVRFSLFVFPFFPSKFDIR